MFVDRACDVPKLTVLHQSHALVHYGMLTLLVKDMQWPD
jgi:hypothetical protein